MFKDQKDSVRKVLEIGIGHKGNMPPIRGYVKGASLFMWREFFPNAQVYGADILPELVFKDVRIETFQCDQTKKDDLHELIRKTGSGIDILIDDGSHLAEDQLFTCLTLMPLLNKDVTYCIEDMKDIGIIDKIRDEGYEVNYDRFKPKLGIDDRLVIVKYKKWHG